MFGKHFFAIKSARNIFLHQWVWGAFVRTALTPLLFVELALLAIYMLSHEWSRTENIAAVQGLASNELSRLVKNQAETIEYQLAGVSQLTELLRQETQDALKQPVDHKIETSNRYAMTDDGMLYTRANDGGAAVFFSGFVKIDPAKKQKIARTERLDSTLRRIIDINPLTVQAYFNSYDSLNRILPYFDVLSQYPPKMDISSYGFYYEADAKHNPERKTRWIDAYLDPAGQGWMVSSISPVYNGDFLEGVVGLDITLDVIIKQVLALPIPWQGFAVLINKDGMLLAVPERAEKLFGLHELTVHHYDQAIRQQTFKPDDFNIYRRSDMSQLQKALANDHSGSDIVDFTEPYLVSSVTLPSTGWRLVVFAPQNEIFKPATALSERLTMIGWYLVGGLCFFYLLFFGFLYQRARRLSHEISDPLRGIQNMAIQIGEGNFKPDTPVYRVNEFKLTVEQMLQAADQLHHAEQQLVDAKEQAEQANYAKGAFLANMSHELRTPLNAITGLTELAQDSAIDKKQKRYLTKIQQSSQSLLLIVNDILDFSNSEAGKIELKNHDFSIEELMQGLADLFVHSIENKHMELLITIAPAVPRFIWGDVQRIRQVLIKLIGNAIKFTEQGEIEIAVDVVVQQNQRAVRFLVRDTGIGIATEDAKFIFQEFIQVDDLLSRKFGGTGLGLAICQQLVSLMGGVISVSSQLGKGSTFQFTLGLKAEANVEPVLNTGLELGLRVLLIDDNPMFCEVLQHYLQEWKCQVNRASSLSQAMIEIRQASEYSRPFDLLLLKGELWQADGFVIAEALDNTGLQVMPDIILLIKGHYQESLQPQVNVNLRPKALLNKPVLPSRLLKAIQATKPKHVRTSTLTTHVAKESTDSLQLPGFNLHEILALLGEDNAQLCHILAMFKEDFSPIVDQLSSHLIKEEWSEAQTTLHTIKGVSGNMGAMMLYDISEELEQQLKNSRFEDETWDRWKATFAESMKTISDFLDNRHMDSPSVSATVFNKNVTPFLHELDALLSENAYIGSELLDKIDSALGENQVREYSALLNSLRHYDYPEARRVLANMINSVGG